jgi:hypothetical protein
MKALEDESDHHGDSTYFYSMFSEETKTFPVRGFMMPLIFKTPYEIELL